MRSLSVKSRSVFTAGLLELSHSAELLTALTPMISWRGRRRALAHSVMKPGTPVPAGARLPRQQGVVDDVAAVEPLPLDRDRAETGGRRMLLEQLAVAHDHQRQVGRAVAVREADLVGLGVR